jgi:hypothetical protein
VSKRQHGISGRRGSLRNYSSDTLQSQRNAPNPLVEFKFAATRGSRFHQSFRFGDGRPVFDPGSINTRSAIQFEVDKATPRSRDAEIAAEQPNRQSLPIRQPER